MCEFIAYIAEIFQTKKLIIGKITDCVGTFFCWNKVLSVKFFYLIDRKHVKRSNLHKLA